MDISIDSDNNIIILNYIIYIYIYIYIYIIIPYTVCMINHVIIL